MSSTERSTSGGVTTGLAEIAILDDEGIRIVAVTGELDISNVGALKQVSFGTSNQTLGVVLDLSPTAYIDSSTLGLLFNLSQGLHRRGQVLCVVSTPDSNVRRVLELAGFDDEHTYERREAAIAAIRDAVPLHE